MSQKLLSFIMPTYNSANYISTTLDSLFKSIGDNISVTEVICVDDGSSDSTTSIIEQYMKNYSNIRLFKNKHAGVSVARNTALANITGRYFTFVDSDDLFVQGAIDKFISKKLKFDVLFTDVKNLENEVCYRKISEREKLEVFKNNFGIGEYRIHPGIAGKFFRTEFVREKKIMFNTSLSFAEDILFNFSALTESEIVILSEMPFYIVNGTHSLMFYNDKNLSGQIVFVDEIRKLLKSYSKSPSRDTIEKMIILKAMTVFIDRYFGPLWYNGTYSLSQSAKLLKNTIECNHYSEAFNNSTLDYTIGSRYVVFRKLLKFRLYKLCLIYNRFMDKIKGYERFRKDI